MALAPKTIVKSRYSGAWSYLSAQRGEWVIMSGTIPSTLLGFGKSAILAWRDAADKIEKVKS
jgi:hypothetical protein